MPVPCTWKPKLVHPRLNLGINSSRNCSVTFLFHWPYHSYSLLPSAIPLPYSPIFPIVTRNTWFIIVSCSPAQTTKWLSTVSFLLFFFLLPAYFHIQFILKSLFYFFYLFDLRFRSWKIVRNVRFLSLSLSIQNNILSNNKYSIKGKKKLW